MATPRKKKTSRKGLKQTNKYFHTLDSLHLVNRADRAIQESHTNDKPANVLTGRRSSDNDYADLYDRWLSLSEREQEVTYLACLGYKNQQIAFRLGVSTRTVKSYLEHVYLKMGVHSKVELRLKMFNFDFERYIS